MEDRIWEEDYRRAVEDEGEEDEDDGWVTEEEEEKYLESPMKGVGVMNVESEYEFNHKDH